MKERKEDIREKFIEYASDSTGFIFNDTQKEMMRLILNAEKVNLIMCRQNGRRN